MISEVYLKNQTQERWGMPESEESWTFRKVPAWAVLYTGPSLYFLYLPSGVSFHSSSTLALALFWFWLQCSSHLMQCLNLDMFSTLPLQQKSNLGVLTLLLHFSLGPSSRLIPLCCSQQLIVTADSNGALHMYQNITFITPSKDRHLYILTV